jgi:hypothetical protein
VPNEIKHIRVTQKKKLGLPVAGHSLADGLAHPCSLFGWLVADGWCWFVLREDYCWLVAGD